MLGHPPRVPNLLYNAQAPSETFAILPSSLAAPWSPDPASSAPQTSTSTRISQDTVVLAIFSQVLGNLQHVDSFWLLAAVIYRPLSLSPAAQNLTAPSLATMYTSTPPPPSLVGHLKVSLLVRHHLNLLPNHLDHPLGNIHTFIFLCGSKYPEIWGGKLSKNKYPP